MGGSELKILEAMLILFTEGQASHRPFVPVLVSEALKLQNKAARIVTNSPFDASATPLLQILGWPSVQKLISKETGSMVYKSLSSLAPQYLSDLS